MRRLPVAGLVLLAVVGGCDWTKFDDLALKAGVRAIPRPDDMDSNLYPSVVLPVARPRGSAELLVLGADNGALADFTFGPDGHLGIQTVGSDRFLLSGARVGPLATQRLAERDYTLAAYLADPSDDVPRVVAVLDADRQPIVMTLDSATADFAITTLGEPLSFPPDAIGVGPARVATGTDIVITSSELVVLPYASPDPVERCDLPAAATALVVGDQWLAVGQGSAGQVWFLTPPYDAPNLPCPQQDEITNRTGGVGFGTALLAGDVDGDLIRELVVSAPAEKSVYIFDPADVTAHPVKYTLLGGSASFGTTMAIGVIEDKRTLIIGDPDYVGEVPSPGVVWLMDPGTGNATPLVSPNTDDVLRFGQQVGVVSFAGPVGPVDLVWAMAESATVGDPGVLYLFFWVSSVTYDPRVF